MKLSELKALCIRAIEEAETRERKMGKENWLHCRIDKHHSVSYRLSLIERTHHRRTADDLTDEDDDLGPDQ